ncbi:MAG: alpha/beta hydrolase fold protein [Ilumatobacteraceae bacterium]|nr:alpha/beta hydrolase fold protein [Ilumatobacteraceae bacterium]
MRFEDFVDERIRVGSLRLRVRHAGDGPPVVLIHGHPRTGSTWHRVAPALAEAGHTVVVPDMRGYGQSDKPVVLADHSQQSKRAVADDIVGVMDRLGHPSFSVVGHDRGAVVALRLALDHPDRVDHLVVLDAVPIVEHLARCDVRFATAWYHWFFFAVPDKPERAINADPLAWYAHDRDLMGEQNHDEWKAAVSNPATVRAMLEDYRAGLGIDADHERADRAGGRTVDCPTLALWSARDDLEALHGDPLTIWRNWCRTVTGHSLECRHHMAEEAPAELAADLLGFLGGGHPAA